jgi:hypothetical protein
MNDPVDLLMIAAVVRDHGLAEMAASPKYW